MLAATSYQLEYLGQPAFGWWILIPFASGIALLLYALLLYHEHDEKLTPRVTSRGPILAAAIGTLTLALSIVLYLLQTPPHLPALLWTFFAAILAVWLFYQRVFHYLTRPRFISLFLLRALGLVALLMLLFEPVLGFTHRNDQRPKLALMVDASGSMSTYDQPNAPHRYRQSTLAVQDILLPKLADLYDLQLFAYDGQHSEPLPRAEAYDKIEPTGTVTDLGTALSLATSQGAQRIVLFSDGIHNGPQSISAVATGISAQVFTVKVGSDNIDQSTLPDIAIAGIDGPQTATVNNQVTLTALIKSTALSDRTIHVQLKTAGNQNPTAGQILDEQRLVLHSGPTPQTLQFKFTPSKTGRMVVRVQAPIDMGERNAANNQQDFPLLITDPKLAVLYVEGRVRPEVGPLRRALEQDPNISATSMVQVQTGLFTLSGIKPGDDLRGLPTTLAQWKRFRVIILGDLDASFLNTQQQRDLAQAVKDGTGLLMIGGQNSFAPGHWNNTVLADLLPVSLEPVNPPQVNTPFVPQLTAAGSVHPIFKNITAYFLQPGGEATATQLPSLFGCVALAAAKPGATILAFHPSAKINGQPAIVLAVEQYGSARTAAFAADTTWRWGLSLHAIQQDSPYNRFWGQMVRWLANQEDLQKQTGASVTALLAKDRYESGQQVLLRCAVTDKQGQSTNFAGVSADVLGPDGKTAHVDLAALADQIGTYEASYSPSLAGDYEVTFHAIKDDAPLGQDKTTFTLLQAAGEMDSLAANTANLQALAVNGGSYQELSGSAVTDLAQRLASLVAPELQATHTILPLYHPRGFFLLFVAALAFEWFLRRRWQLQ